MSIITLGGKQYNIKPDQTVTVEKLSLKVGDTFVLTDVLTQKPVNIEVVEQTRGAKVIIRKFRNKTRYHRLRGHRQLYTVVRLNDSKANTPKTVRSQRKTTGADPAEEA